MGTVLLCCPQCAALAPPAAAWCSLCFASLLTEPQAELEPQPAPEPGPGQGRPPEGEGDHPSGAYDADPTTSPESEDGAAAGFDLSVLRDRQDAAVLPFWSGQVLSPTARVLLGFGLMAALMAALLGGLTLFGVLFL